MTDQAPRPLWAALSERYARVQAAWATPTDAAWLAALRFLLGATLCVSMLRFIAYGWIDLLFVNPRFHFKYWGFSWVQALPASYMHALFYALAALSACIALGQWFRVSALLFALGLTGVIIRRNILVIYMSLELMLNAANLAFVAMSRYTNNLNGQVMVFFIITVAAAEVAVGLALIVALYRKRQTAHVEDLTSMKL